MFENSMYRLVFKVNSQLRQFQYRTYLLSYGVNYQIIMTESLCTRRMQLSDKMIRVCIGMLPSKPYIWHLHEIENARNVVILYYSHWSFVSLCGESDYFSAWLTCISLITEYVRSISTCVIKKQVLKSSPWGNEFCSDC